VLKEGAFGRFTSPCAHRTLWRGLGGVMAFSVVVYAGNRPRIAASFTSPKTPGSRIGGHDGRGVAPVTVSVPPPAAAASSPTGGGGS